MNNSDRLADFIFPIEDIAIEIDSYFKTVMLLIKISKSLNSKIYKQKEFPLEASSIINFRDSINHYVILYEAFEKEQAEIFIEQRASINEHLNRGLKDSLIHLLQLNSEILESIMNGVDATSEKSKMRISLHSMKNTILDIRLNNIKIKRIKDYDYIVDKVKETLTATLPFLKKYKNKIDRSIFS